MNKPYLIQRLKKPLGVENPYSFGGGRINGGINKESMKLINQVFSFDYMGSAEFEWGAVPTALAALMNGNTITFSLHNAIWVICLENDKEEVRKWILDASVGKHGHLKEHLGFKEALSKEKYADYLGWLKIEDDRFCTNPFMFFIDK